MGSPRLNIPFLLWWRLHRQLRRRSGGVRESGAFLLGSRSDAGINTVRHPSELSWDIVRRGLSPTLEDLYIPSAAHIVAAARKTMKGGKH